MRSFIPSWWALTAVVTFSSSQGQSFRKLSIVFFFFSKVQRRQANIFSGECICGFSNSCLRFLSAYPSSSVGARGVFIVFFLLCRMIVFVHTFGGTASAKRRKSDVGL